MKYLPDERDWEHLDKHWVSDLMYSLDQEGMTAMIHDAMAKRKDKLEKSRDLLVSLRPEFAQALLSC